MGHAAPATAEFSWTAHPASERVGAAVAGLAIVAAVAGALFLSFQSLAWSGFAVLVLVASLNRFFFRSRFTIDDDGITARFPLRTRRLVWTDVQRFLIDAHGAYLSTRRRRTWLDAYRGLHLLFGRDRDAVTEHVRVHLPNAKAKATKAEAGQP